MLKTCFSQLHLPRSRPRLRFETGVGKRLTVELRPEMFEGFRRGDLKEESARAKVRPVGELFTWKHEQ